MSDRGLESRPEGDAVLITARARGKAARLLVTPEYARRFARELLIAASQAEGEVEEPAKDPLTWLERLQRMFGERP